MVLMDKSVVLDNRSFKALSAESRVSILKNLGERRMTLSELSKRLDLEASTVKEHCNVLSDAELIKMIDEGRKWKYYELTNKGRQLVAPTFMDEVKVLIVLCFAFVIFGGLLFSILQATAGASYLAAGSPSLASSSSTMLTNAATLPQGAPEIAVDVKNAQAGAPQYGIAGSAPAAAGAATSAGSPMFGALPGAFSPINMPVYIQQQTATFRTSTQNSPAIITDYGMNFDMITAGILFVLVFGIILGWAFQRATRK